MALIDIIIGAVIVQPQLLDCWLEKKTKKHVPYGRRGSLDLIWEPGAEQRSPCVQFLAVMKSRASRNWPNLRL